MNRSSPAAWPFGALALVALVLFATGCPDNSAPCSGDEEVSVKMTGTCAAGERRLIITRRSCAINISSDPATTGGDGGAPPPAGLPMNGATDMSNNPIRQGGWFVWGCVAGREPCPDQFRICTAQRVAFQLNVSCVDGVGAPACEAVLTE